MLLSTLLVLCVGTVPLEVPRLEKVWRTELPGSAAGLFFHPSGELLSNVRLIEWKEKAFHREFDRMISLCPEGKIESRFSFPDKTRGHAFTRDGKHCVILKNYRGNDLEVWDMATGQALRSTSNKSFSSMYSHLTMHPDSKHFLVVNRGEVQYWNLETLQQEEVLPSLDRHSENHILSQLHITPDGTLLGLYARHFNYENKPGDMVVWDFRQRKIVREIKLPDAPRHTGWSSDGNYLFQFAELGELRLWKCSSTGSEPDIQLSGLTKPGHLVKVHPTLPLVASASSDHTVMLWDLRSKQAISRNTFPKSSYAMDFAFAPDGKHLYVQGNTKKDTPDGKFAWTGFVTRFALPQHLHP